MYLIHCTRILYIYEYSRYSIDLNPSFEFFTGKPCIHNNSPTSFTVLLHNSGIAVVCILHAADGKSPIILIQIITTMTTIWAALKQYKLLQLRTEHEPSIMPEQDIHCKLSNKISGQGVFFMHKTQTFEYGQITNKINDCLITASGKLLF